MAALWEIGRSDSREQTPYEILKEYARMLRKDTDEMFLGEVLQTVEQDGSISAVLYVQVPQLRNYSYRLMEMRSSNYAEPYPVSMYLYGKAPGNVHTDMAINSVQFKGKVELFIQHPLTKMLLESLKVQIDILHNEDD